MGKQQYTAHSRSRKGRGEMKKGKNARTQLSTFESRVNEQKNGGKSATATENSETEIIFNANVSV